VKSENPARRGGAPNGSARNHPPSTTDPRMAPAAIEAELAAISSWKPAVPDDLPRLTDDERERVHARIDELVAERLGRADVFRDRLARTARHLGRQVGAHRVLLTDAERRLEQLAREHDPDTSVPITLIDHSAAKTITAEAFAAGMNEQDLS
jgi:phytoene dehydrogenase-like protein